MTMHTWSSTRLALVYLTSQLPTQTVFMLSSPLLCTPTHPCIACQLRPPFPGWMDCTAIICCAHASRSTKKNPTHHTLTPTHTHSQWAALLHTWVLHPIEDNCALHQRQLCTPYLGLALHPRQAVAVNEASCRLCCTCRLAHHCLYIV